MTIATTTNRISYTGNGVTTLFAVPFTYYNASDLKVYVDGVLKTITTDYTVGSGGVTFVTAPANTKVVLIVREVPMTQTTDYKNFEPVDADELETNIDKLTILVQQADEKASRGINLDVTDSATSLTLPVTRANKVLAFDASGLPVASTQTLAQIEAGSTNAAASAVAAAASAAAALVSENNAATTYDAFDDRYLGQKASDPTVDNDGNTLLVGALYFDTASNVMRVWNGSAWSSINPPFDLATQVTGRLPNANLAQVSTATFKGRTTAGTGNVEDLTGTQATTLLDTFTSALKGLTPASGGGTVNFLRADGTWASTSKTANFVSAAGVATDITGLPAGINWIMLSFDGISTNGTSGLIVQIGDSGGIETTGYVSVTGTGTTYANSGIGFQVSPTTIAATNTRSGQVLLTRHPFGNNWMCSHNLGDWTNNTTSAGGGSKVLSDTLDRVRITTLGGANTFDAGGISMAYGV